MKQETTATASTEPSRCQHSTATGRRCRSVALDTNTGLCFRHFALRNTQSDSIDLSSAFGDKLSQFNTAVGIHDFVAQLTTLLVQSRISCRRASVLAFCSQLLLRTLPAIEHEINGDDRVQVIINGVPQRPDEFPRTYVPPSHPVLTEFSK